MSEWARLQGRSGSKDVWLGAHGRGKPEISGDPWYMPDGKTSVYPFITDWHPEKIPFPVWLAPYNRGQRYGDMLWTGGLGLKIMSNRMIEALTDLKVTGYRVFDVDVRDAAGLPLDDYVGFATDPFPGSDIQNLYGQTWQNYAFIAKVHVVEGLRSRGVDRLEIRPYDPDEGADLL